ncbi:MAG: SDR family NAD(P)-dependent oxidoreductase [Terriglobales bacterium]
MDRAKRSPRARNVMWKLARATITLGGLGLTGAAAGAAVLAVGYQSWRERSRVDWTGQVVLVSGGSRGLGYAIAREFVDQGARVAICARDSTELERARLKLAPRAGPAGGVFPLTCDLRQPDMPGAVVDAVRSHWGRVDVLVHNAGVIQVGPWDLMGEADFAEAMDIHFWAALRLARAVLPDMIARRQGRIVNISSIGGVVPVPHMLPYTASKFALVGLSQGLASEVRRDGVRVTCVCPFLTRTGSQEHVTIRGDHDREYAWFATSGSMPGTSQSAAHVARAVLRAAAHGPAQVTLALPGKLAALAHGVAPSATVAAMAQANRLLPQPRHGDDAAARSGADSYNAWTNRVVRPLVQQAGSELNQA